VRKIGLGAKILLVVSILMAAPVTAIFGQGPPQSNEPQSKPTLLARAEGETPVPGKCLYKEDLDLIAARNSLKRTTLNNDQEAPFDPDYLVGNWKFEYDVPESALGPEGKISGTETIQYSGGCLYEGSIQAKGPAGPFTIKSTMLYDPSVHYLVILERDSRGFEVLKTGRVGGDGGGFYTHAWQAAPFTFKGKKVRLKGSIFMSSPINYRLRTEISEGNDPFVNLGTVWFRRQSAPGGK
jgi:hypothetical protein